MPALANLCKQWMLGRAALCCLMLCATSCMSNPFKNKPSATPADIARFGPTANQRIKDLKAMREAGPGSDPTAHESKATELARKIQTERDPLVRAQIVRTIEMYPTRLTSAVLHAATNDPEPAVRIACADAWGKRNTDEAVENLSELFKKDESIDVRLAAIKGLGTTKNKAAIEKLAPALEDKDPALQFVAVESLQSITGITDLGYDVNKWREYVKAPDAERPQQGVADRLRQLF
jgi:hypothetical protein